MESILSQIERENDENHRNIHRIITIRDEIDHKVANIMHHDDSVELTINRIRSLEKTQQRENNDVRKSDRTLLIDSLKDEAKLKEEFRDNNKQRMKMLHDEYTQLKSLVDKHEYHIVELQEQYDGALQDHITRESLVRRRLVAGSVFIRERMKKPSITRVECRITFPNGTIHTSTFGSMVELYTFVEMNESVDSSYTIVTFDNHIINTLPTDRSALRITNQQ
jgi:hypothetical protein